MVEPEETNLTPGADRNDMLRIGGQQRQLDVSPAGRALLNFLAVMNASGVEADDVYKDAVAMLRRQADDVVIEIARRADCCQSGDYPTRWGLIYAASELHHPAALPFFRSVVLTPIPPEESDDPHSFSTVGEETILRTTAVDGVALLAADGDRDAIESLFAFLAVPSMSVKRAAVQALLNAGRGESLRGKIEELICPEDRFLLDIRPLDVRKVTQVRDPEAHLSEDGRASTTPTAPDLRDRASYVQAHPADDGPSSKGGSKRKGREQ